MRIRTAPPFVGRTSGCAPGSARCRRAPAIAFAPRTASRKASSVLACRRRVCGRLCTALLQWCFGVRPQFRAPVCRGLSMVRSSEPADVAGRPGLPAALGVELECGGVLHRRRVVLCGRGQSGQCRPRPELELVRAAVSDGVVAAGLVLTDAGPVGRVRAGGVGAPPPELRPEPAPDAGRGRGRRRRDAARTARCRCGGLLRVALRTACCCCCARTS